ncbi:MAG: HAD family hydrolase [Phycisphaerae bacterium]
MPRVYLWDTLVIDDSDEPKRAAQGLPPKSEARPRVVYDALHRHHDVPFEAVALAYRTAAAAFNSIWHDLHVTWTVRQRLSVMLAGLGLRLPEEDLDHVVRTLEEMEVLIPPDLVPGVHEALEVLHEEYTLAVVSDAIVSPGRALRELLGQHDLAGYFDAFVFSDEIGCAKPDPRIFQAAADALGVDLAHVVHVGDRDHNDVKGAQAVGARAVLLTAARDKDKHRTAADAVCESFADLPAIIDRFDAR